MIPDDRILTNEVSTGMIDPEAVAFLKANLEPTVLNKGDVLFREGDPGAEMFVVVEGHLGAAAGGSESFQDVFRVGTPVGAVQFLAGGRRTTTVTALEPSRVVALTGEAFDQLVERFPDFERQVAEVVRRRIRLNKLRTTVGHLLGSVDEALIRDLEAQVDWVYLRRGQPLFRQGDPGDGIYFVVTGRLRAVLEDPGEAPRILGEVPVGEILGEMAFFTGEPRSASVYAVRDSVVVKLSNEEFEQIIARYPQVTVNVSRLLIERLRRTFRPAAASEVTNIAVVALGEALDRGDFSRKLSDALSANGPVLHLNAESLDELAGAPGLAHASDDDVRVSRLLALLDEQEDRHRFVVYEADAGSSPWTARCIRQADHVILLADASSDPDLREVEVEHLADLGGVAEARRSLVLMHPPGTEAPAGTDRWLSVRSVDAHHHMRHGDSSGPARLARFLSGKAVGLVLGGGGARGFAHIGIIRALREAGIPIDLVGGTSMGASMAAQCAMGWNHNDMLRRNREGWIDLRAHREYTLPILSLLKGRKAGYMGDLLYGEHAIEDLWTPFFCVSTNLNTAEPTVHTSGSLRTAATASASLPGVVVPVLHHGEMLVDGGILNNVPVDVMRSLGAGVVIAVDVSSAEDRAVEFESFPSPWLVLRNRLFGTPCPDVPTIMEVLLRTTLLASVSRSNATRKMADFYLEPRLSGFSLMGFEALDDIAEEGYRYGREAVADLASLAENLTLAETEEAPQ